MLFLLFFQNLVRRYFRHCYKISVNEDSVIFIQVLFLIIFCPKWTALLLFGCYDYSVPESIAFWSSLLCESPAGSEISKVQTKFYGFETIGRKLWSIVCSFPFLYLFLTDRKFNIIGYSTNDYVQRAQKE